MEKEICILELFSGIGGFTKGMQDAGFTIKKHYYSEIDKHAIANYKYNFQDAEYIGSVTDVSKWDIKRPTCITFGSPCQDFSVAGKGSGLGGYKSSLITYAIMAIERFKPDIFIWENVKGAFSTNAGADYWAIIQAFANLPGYRFEQQLVNTSWVLPQNRERIYIIGHLAGRSEPRVFPFREGDIGCIKGSTETPIVRAITAGGHSGGHHSGMTLISVKALTETRTEEAKEIRRESRKEGKDFSPRRGKELVERNDNNANTITSTQGVEQLIKIQVKSATLSGFETAYPGDSPNLQFPNSTTRKGRVGKQTAQCLDSKSDQAVFIRQKARGFNNGSDLTECPTITINSFEQNNHVSGVRRLTEIECERLQGFDNSWRDKREPDNWTEWGLYPTKKLKKAPDDLRKGISQQDLFNELPNEEKILHFKEAVKKKVPKSHRYKLCGNAVTKDIVEMIAKRLIK